MQGLCNSPRVLNARSEALTPCRGKGDQRGSHSRPALVSAGRAGRPPSKRKSPKSLGTQVTSRNPDAIFWHPLVSHLLVVDAVSRAASTQLVARTESSPCGGAVLIQARLICILWQASRRQRWITILGSVASPGQVDLYPLVGQRPAKVDHYIRERC